MRKNIFLTSLAFSAFAIYGCSEKPNEVALKDAPASTAVSSSLLSSISADQSVEKSSSSRSSVPASTLDKSSLLGASINGKAIYPFSLTIIDHDEKSIMVRAGTAFGHESPDKKDSLVYIGDTGPVSLSPINDNVFEIPVDLAKTMLSSVNSVIQLHVGDGRYYEADFTLAFDGSFRKALTESVGKK